MFVCCLSHCAALKTLDEYTSSYPQCPEAISAGRTSILMAAGLDPMKKATKSTFLQCHEIVGLHSALIHFAYGLGWRAFRSEILQTVQRVNLEEALGALVKLGSIAFQYDLAKLPLHVPSACQRCFRNIQSDESAPQISIRRCTMVEKASRSPRQMLL